MISDYKDLVVWQKAMTLAEMVYKLTESFPKEEIYGLTSQMRRAAVSIPSNIAEGNSRFYSKEYSHFLSIANGSKAELETQLILSVNIGYTDKNKIIPLLDLSSEIGKILVTILRKL